MNGPVITRDDREAIRFVTSWPIIFLFGLGIPGFALTDTIFGLESALVRDRFTLWVYWLMVSADVIAALFALACRYTLRDRDKERLTKILFVQCVIWIILGLIGTTILCTLRYEQ